MNAARAQFRFSPRANRASEIAWRPWGEEVFVEARRLGRPVLLSLSAVWCHWCHVMDETSYSDPRVIGRVNDDFVPVRVDNDRDPDVNRRYNMGGWPTTAFLTESGEVLTGATYLPPDQMVAALDQVRAYYDEHREELAARDLRRAIERTTASAAGDAAAGESATSVEEQATERTAAPHRAGSAPGSAREMAPSAAPFDASATVTIEEQLAFAGEPTVPGDLVDQVALEVVRTLDPLHGGVGSEPKFPQAEVFGFLLAYAGLRGEGDSPLLAATRLHEALRVTLARMAAGDVYDDVGGGFFRYATRRDWTVPHYEKMLEDNSRLALLYLDAALAAGSGDAPSYRHTAAGVMDYLGGTLWRGDPPAFSGSQDADEHYYTLDAAARSELDAPFVDTTVYVDWNALAARALLRAARVLGRPELKERAVALLDYLWAHARRDGILVHYLLPEGEQGTATALLGDQAAMAAALLDAYEITGRHDLLGRAEALATWVGGHLRAADGRLLDREPGGGGLLDQPLPAPEDNAVMADVLLRLEAYTGELGYRQQGIALLAAWAPHVGGFGVGAAPLAAALLRGLGRPDHLVVVGADGDATAAALHDAALAATRPLRTVQRLDPHRDVDRLAARGLPAGADTGAGAAAAVYVCRGTSCLAPAHSQAELSERLAAG